MTSNLFFSSFLETHQRNGQDVVGTSAQHLSLRDNENI